MGGSGCSHATSDGPSSGLLFRFMDLHIEICQRILEYTDLVTPAAHVIWCLGHLDARGRHYISRGAIFKPSMAGWKPPTAMFLVSRDFSALAQIVFLSRNYFEVCDCEPGQVMDGLIWGLIRGTKRPQPDVSKAAAFLSRPMSSEFLSSITSLEIEYPMLWAEPRIGPDGLRQWQQTLERFKDSFKPRRLIMWLKEDLSMPFSDEMRGVDFPWSFLHQDGIDVVRQYVDSFWPIQRLGQLDDVKMFLWDARIPGEGMRTIYYCRHQSEPLPESVGDMILTRLHPLGEVHVQRPFRRPHSARGNWSLGNEWIEGIFARTHCENDSWFKNGLNHKSWLPCSPDIFLPKLPPYCTSAARLPEWSWEYKSRFPGEDVSQSSN